MILWAGRHQRAPWEALCGEYRGRITRYATLRDQRIKARRGGNDKALNRSMGGSSWPES